MSYWVGLYTTQGHYDCCEHRNMTSNVAGMWHKALGFPLSELKDRACTEALPDLERAVKHMEEHPEIYKPMNPANGWGNYESALDFLRWLRDGCREHPLCLIYMSY